jgi:hypothetical protein
MALQRATLHRPRADARVLPRSGTGGGGNEPEDGKMDASFHSPAYIAAHIASLQARAPFSQTHTAARNRPARTR